MIILMAGLPGTGKSTLAEALAQQTGGVVLDKDKIRPALFPAADIEYSTEQDDFCMTIMLQTATYLLKREPARLIFLDGRPFSRGYQIDAVLECARALGQPWRILECVCREQTARERLAASASHPAGNRDFNLYRGVREGFEPITAEMAVIDTDRELQECVEQARNYLRAENNT
jgi:adenylylsulfate kinase